jgi:mono/diheme cytochrome c family protein
MIRSAILCALFALFVASSSTSRAADPADQLAQRAWTVISAKCLACHGNDAERIKGGLNLTTRAGALAGGESERTVLAPGKPDESLLYIAATRKDPQLPMPPKDNDALSADQLKTLREWILAGAPWPGEKPAASAGLPGEGVTVKTSGGLSPDWTNRKYKPEDIWAWQPLRKPDVPTIRNPQSAIRNPVDAFIAAPLALRQIPQAPPADKTTLIRRATFDLTGLPPTPAEVDAFVKDKSSDAFARLVKRLLDSPHYGEQQARHWLDVTRYADTAGFSNDYERPHAWRYRDYVVRSFNADKPYDRFILEQVAGDELEPANLEMRIAVGFLRMGPWEHTGMTVAAVTRQDFLDDVTHHVGVTFLGQGLRCARCHDHKFDPVPARDYYRIQAAFASTQFAERPSPFLPGENMGDTTAARSRVEKHLAEAREVLASLRKKNLDAIAAYEKDHGAGSVGEFTKSGTARRDNFGLTKEELSARKTHQKRQDCFERELRRFEAYALSVYSGPPNNYTSVRPLYGVPTNRVGVVQVVHVLSGGALESPADEVTPGVLSALEAFNPQSAIPVPQSASGRRTALAKWIASPQNTLTARVIVNRVWQQHFGRGLVATPNNFGAMGGKPTHPELLDWLAGWFVENGWSLKKLHALILNSATYQQSSVPGGRGSTRAPSSSGGKSQGAGGTAPSQIDPKNELLSYFPTRRLAAEELRDSMLAVTGELNPQSGGHGVFPEINWEVAFQPRHIMGSVAPAYQPSPTSAERNRRTLYAFRIRTLADPMLEVFNRPGSETSCEHRDATTVTPQVFSLMNGDFVNNRALAFAASLEKSAPTLKGRIELAFRRAFGRAPTSDELKSCEAHFNKMVAHHRANTPKPVELPTKVKRHMVEEMTGEDFFWDEELDVLKNYQRDLMPWQAGAETRALAEVCLVLLNANEFVYVR